LSSSDEDAQKVWEKGEIVSGQDPQQWRKDQCGAWIGRTSYGKRESPYGWETDHIDSNGGDSLSNLHPLQWQNNLEKSDKKRLTCVVTAEGINNVRK
jgi:hypothetical protein